MTGEGHPRPPPPVIRGVLGETEFCRPFFPGTHRPAHHHREAPAMTATTPMTATTADRGTERDRPPSPPPGLAPDTATTARTPWGRRVLAARAGGWCVRCGWPAPAGRSCCWSCLRSAADRMWLLRGDRRALGFCGCGRPPDRAGRLCSRCAAQGRDRMRARRRSRR